MVIALSPQSRHRRIDGFQRRESFEHLLCHLEVVRVKIVNVRILEIAICTYLRYNWHGIGYRMDEVALDRWNITCRIGTLNGKS